MMLKLFDIKLKSSTSFSKTSFVKIRELFREIVNTKIHTKYNS